MATTPSPVLTSERLVLRVPTLADAEESAAMWADPVVTRFIGGAPSPASAAWTRLLAYVGHWDLMGYGYFAVRERATGRFVGESGIADHRREIDPPLGPHEAGFALVPWAHGRGYATEALRTVLAWGDTALRVARTTCLIAPDNAASHRVVQKCGYERVREALYKGAPTVVYERRAPGR
jgi:RimJ/RimL family protein N-acetyltransferase